MATEQAKQVVQDRIASLEASAAQLGRQGMPGALSLTATADALQWCLDTLTADDPVAALPAKWRGEAALIHPFGTAIVPAHDQVDAERLEQCADELDAALKGER